MVDGAEDLGISLVVSTSFDCNLEVTVMLSYLVFVRQGTIF